MMSAAAALLVAAISVSCASSPRQTPEPVIAPAPVAAQQAPVRTEPAHADTIFPRPDPSKFSAMATGLMYRDVVIGPGMPAVDLRELQMNYSGWLEDGTMFDSSRRSAREPFKFTLGRDPVIPGWEAGVRGMRAGGRRILIIPASLGYGAAGQPPTIPANATLVFDIELISVR